jgi:hypothetical protein
LAFIANNKGTLNTPASSPCFPFKDLLLSLSLAPSLRESPRLLASCYESPKQVKVALGLTTLRVPLDVRPPPFRT